MRIFPRILIPAMLMVALSGLPARAQTKIATVDLDKIFHNYYKTKLAEADIQQRKDELDKDYTSMTQDFKKSSDQYELTLESADDPAVSDQERSRRKMAADDQLKQLQDRKAALEQFQRQAQITLGDQEQRMVEGVLTDIKKDVANQAKIGGYTLVLNSSATAASGAGPVVYSTSEGDLTDAVLKDLNASAPPDLPDTTTTPVYISTNSPSYAAPGGTSPILSTPGSQ